MSADIAVVVGLDPSLTSTGLVTLDQTGNVVRAEVIAPRRRGATGVERLNDFWLQVAERVAGIPEQSLWVIEGYAMGMPRGSSPLTYLAELGGVIRLGLYRAGMRIVNVPPARLKKFACGVGNAKKDEVRLHVYKRWGFEHPSNDVVDAYALARLGLAIEGHDTNLTVAQRAVVDDLIRAGTEGAAMADRREVG